MERARDVFMDVINSMGQLFVGMEYFVGSYKPTWDAIEHRLQRSDGLILLVGGTYGSAMDGTPTGISYTEGEFDWAQKHNLPTIVFLLHPDSLGNLMVKDAEQHPA